MIDRPIAVCSRTFSKHPVLRAELEEKFSNIRFNDYGVSLKGDELVEFLKDRDGAIVALEKLDRAVIEQLPQLKAVAKYGVGLDNLDQAALREKDIQLGWTGGLNRRSVAELALIFMMGLVRNVFTSGEQLKNREWKNKGGADLTGKTIGIIGCGFIGSDLLQILRGFDCELLVNDIVDKSAVCAEFGARPAEKDEIFSQADIVTLHVPYDDSTHHLINADVLKKMKNSAVVVNTARGNVVDEAALLTALKEGQIAAAGLDVFANEPPLESGLLDLPNFWCTPHIGGSSAESILKMGRAAIDNLVKTLS